MTPERSFRRIAILLAAGTFTLGLAACGSDDTGESATTGTGVQTTGGQNGSQSGQITPDKKAPDSAGERKNAPDDVISERPGGPDSPVQP